MTAQLSLYQDLEARGILKQVTDPLDRCCPQNDPG